MVRIKITNQTIDCCFLSVPFCPHHFPHTVMFIVQCRFVRTPFCQHHLVRYHFVPDPICIKDRDGESSVMSMSRECGVQYLLSQPKSLIYLQSGSMSMQFYRAGMHNPQPAG